nr:GDSL esterase/lipase At1g28590-like [Ipomoea batatas]
MGSPKGGGELRVKSSTLGAQVEPKVRRSSWGARGEELNLRNSSGGTKLMLSSSGKVKFGTQVLEPEKECKKYLQSSLILMGEIGGNDYNDPFLQGHSIEEIQSFVPNVIATIGAAINELIELGGETFVVPGVLPFGCSPSYLSFFMNSSTNNDYDDKTGCIKWLNEFAEYHNTQLEKELHRLKELHPNTTIMYADYYHAAMELYGSPSKHGLEQSLYACCGTGGPYNSRVDITCGRSPPIVCDKPSSFVSWDGVHLTEAAYQQIASMILEGPYMTPPINEACLLKPLSGEVSDH